MLYGTAATISQQVLRVAYACGTRLYTIFGGFNAVDGRRSRIDVSSIIATQGTSRGLAFTRDRYIPPLNNRTLFKRRPGT